MIVNPNIDYTSTKFEYPVLTKIHVVPTYKALHRIQIEIKANFSSLPCKLSGGFHGYLGLILITEQFTNVLVTTICLSYSSSHIRYSGGHNKL